MLPPLAPSRTERSPPAPYFPPPVNAHSRRPGQGPRSPDLFQRPNPMDGGWAIVPVNTNAPAVTRGSEVGPPITPCKTCQARNTTVGPTHSLFCSGLMLFGAVRWCAAGVWVVQDPEVGVLYRYACEHYAG